MRTVCHLVFLVVILMPASVFAKSFILSGRLVDQAVNLTYNRRDGSMHLMSLGLEGISTTTLDSAGGHFDPSKATFVNSPPSNQFDVNNPFKFFVLTPLPEFATMIDFAPGYYLIGIDDLSTDLTWDGSIAPRGHWSDAPGGGPYLLIIPEPSTAVLACLGVLSLLAGRRKCWT